MAASALRSATTNDINNTTYPRMQLSRILMKILLLDKAGI
jgi:hypothetical protein